MLYLQSLFLTFLLMIVYASDLDDNRFQNIQQRTSKLTCKYLDQHASASSENSPSSTYRIHYWDHLTHHDIHSLIRGNDYQGAGDSDVHSCPPISSSNNHVIAVLPVSATEQHGPHLPLGTDSIIASGVLQYALRELMGASEEEKVEAKEEKNGQSCSTFEPVPPSDGGSSGDIDGGGGGGSTSSGCATGHSISHFVILPLISYGASEEHSSFPGTIWIDDQTLNSYWSSVLRSVTAFNIRKIILLNSHGGQSQNVEMVARKFRFGTGFNKLLDPTILVTAVQLQRMFETDDIFPDTESKYGIHAGAVETSIVMHLCPALIKWDKIQDFTSSFQTYKETLSENKRWKDLEPYGGAVSFGWRTQDLNKFGALGNTLLADPQLGQKIMHRISKKVARIFEDVAQLDLEAYFEKDK